MTLEVTAVNTYISILLWASCLHIIFPNTEWLGYLTCIRLFKYYQPTFTCIQTAAPGDTSPPRTSLQTVFLSGRCCGRSWWSSGPEAGPYPGTARAGPRKRERFRLTSGTGRSHHWTCDLQEKKKKSQGWRNIRKYKHDWLFNTSGGYINTWSKLFALKIY